MFTWLENENNQPTHHLRRPTTFRPYTTLALSFVACVNSWIWIGGCGAGAGLRVHAIGRGQIECIQALPEDPQVAFAWGVVRTRRSRLLFTFARGACGVRVRASLEHGGESPSNNCIARALAGHFVLPCPFPTSRRIAGWCADPCYSFFITGLPHRSPPPQSHSLVHLVRAGGEGA